MDGSQRPEATRQPGKHGRQAFAEINETMASHADKDQKDWEEQQALLNEIRQRVLDREEALIDEQTLQDNLTALKDITQVPQREIERIAQEVRDEFEARRRAASAPKRSVIQAMRASTPPTEGLIPELMSFAELSPSLISSLVPLTPFQQRFFAREYDRQRRSVLSTYLAWIIPPPFSLHYLYLRSYLAALVFFFTLGGFFLWWIVDLLRVPGLVRDHNRDLAESVFRKAMQNPIPMFVAG
jgi:hypothetical protein